MNYFKIPAISNSKLGELNDAMNAKEKQENIADIYNFGSLVDAMITEPALINHKTQSTFIESDEVWLTVDNESWDKACAMKEAYFNNDFCVAFHNMMKFQYVYVRKNFLFHHQGHTASLPVKCKFDYINQKIRKSGDLKGLSIDTRAAFINAISHFNYDRQAAFYMDIAKAIDSHTIIAVSKKKPHPIFIKTIRKGDDLYLQGKEKYNKLGILYDQLVA